MAGKPYIKLDANANLAEQLATVVSTGSANDGDIVALDPSGHLDISVLPTGVGPQTKVIPASEAITGPALVNVWDSTGQKIRAADKATANAGKEANGFVLASVSSGANGTVYFEGEISGLTGLTPGAKYYLGTAGAPTASATTTSGEALQYIGTATSATSIDFEPARPIIRA